MRFFSSIICLTLLIVSCQPKLDNSINEAFEKNSKTIMTYLEGYQNESLDYDALFSKDYWMLDTHVGADNDSLTIVDVIKNDKEGWSTADFKIVSPINLLPGVDADTKKADGSVRYYADWEITISATDSTDARSGVMRIYESFDFDAEGKINFQQYYGDFGGLRNQLKSKEKVVEVEEVED